ncbi:MAG: aldehyde dehydrogenase family protein [Proteobacteria bacterium]|nr:aldehyde dehydrogenase family protein [Pseudomonadota bacterium]
MQNQNARIHDFGKALLSHESKSGMSFLSPHKWSQSLLDKMMENEKFRVASLRFTDVAPSLRNDADFMDHMAAYFGDVGGLDKILAGGIPGSKLLGKVIAPVMRKNIQGMAENFIAGETIEDGVKTLEKLHKQGIACSIDLLGEAVISKKEADDFVAAYHHAIKTIAKAVNTWGNPGYPEADAIGPIMRANVSIKLSALYEHMDIAAHDKTVDILSERFGALLDTAMEHGCYIHVDTEQFQLVPITLAVFKRVLMSDKYKNWPHVGIVVQAYLKSSESILDDLLAFAKQRGTPFSIRLVKGAYWDFEQANAEQRGWPCPVFDFKEETDINYEKLTKKLIKAFPTVRPCIGSHNARSLAVALSTIEECGLSKGDVEFQALFGMADNFRDGVKAMGYRVRQYCPVGAFIPGMSYLVRRLLENTANQSFLRMRARNEAPAELLLAEPVAPGSKDKKTRPFTNRPDFDFSHTALREKAQTALDHWLPRMPMEVRPVIAGKTLSPNKAHKVACPWDSKTTASSVYYATAKDADKAVEAAHAARNDWRNLGFDKRAAILERAADLMEANWDELFALQVVESGKDWLHADADIAEAIDFLRFYAWQARTLEERMQPLSVWGEKNTTVYDPRGVAAVIAPWNFPLAISTGMTAAALVAGNPVVYKPAEQTSANGQAMYRIFREAGVPADVLHFLPGDGAEVGATLVEHPQVAMIAFTGSREVGLKILEAAGKVRPGQTDVKKCVIEMGGKNAIIVDSDADLDEAVPGVVKSAFGFQGQKCSACSRVIVVGSAYEPFVARLKEMVDGLRVGAANNPVFDVNAVIDAEAKEKIESFIAIGKKDGKLLAQAAAPKGAQGNFVPPTVFTDLKKGSRLTQEEVFGPVLAVYKAATVAEAVDMAMDSAYALTGGLFSRNPETIAQVKRTYRVGNLYINRGVTGALVGRQPFGGAKMSGTGTKAGGPDYLLHFVEPRVVTENTMRRGYAPKED